MAENGIVESVKEFMYGNFLTSFATYKVWAAPERYLSAVRQKGDVNAFIKGFYDALELSKKESDNLENKFNQTQSALMKKYDKDLSNVRTKGYRPSLDDAEQKLRNSNVNTKWRVAYNPIVSIFEKGVRRLFDKYENFFNKKNRELALYISDMMNKKKRIAMNVVRDFGPSFSESYGDIMRSIRTRSDEIKDRYSREYSSKLKREHTPEHLRQDLEPFLKLRELLEQQEPAVRAAAEDYRIKIDAIIRDIETNSAIKSGKEETPD